MNLSGLLPLLRGLPEFETLFELLALPEPPGVALGLPRAARAAVVAAIASGSAARPVLVITGRHDRALALVDEITAWLPGGQDSSHKSQGSSPDGPLAGDASHHEEGLPSLSASDLPPPTSHLSPLLFGEPNPLFYEPAAWGQRAVRQRIAALAALTHSQTSFGAGQPGQRLQSESGQPLTPNHSPLIITSARALMTRTVPKREFILNTRRLAVGTTVRLERLLETLVGAGYEAADGVVVEPGQFSRRGGILDIFPPAEAAPVRVELFGDEVESLRRFDPATQRSGELIAAITVTPAREAMPRYWEGRGETLEVGSETASEATGDSASHVSPLTSHLEYRLPLLYPNAGSLLDYLPDDALVIVEDWAELANTVEELESQAVPLRDEQIEAGAIPADFPLPYLPWVELQDELSERRPVHLGPPDDDSARLVDFSGHFAPGPRFGGQIKPLLEHLQRQRLTHDATVVITRQAARLAELWAEQHAAVAPTHDVLEPPGGGALIFVQGALAEGFLLRATLESHDETGLAAPSTLHPQPALHLLTDAEVFGWSRPEPRRRSQRRTALGPEAEYADFSPGDYVVHVEYGIGRFGGLVRRTVDRIEREYLFVEYGGGDELYVPIHQADRLTRYVGVDERPPTLSRLGTADWTRVRERTQQAVLEVARELLELYARRETAPGHAFAPDTPWQRELEDSFPYVETEDQLRAVAEVKTDMEKSRPMDRLICGDVGYGKTEVALRAAFKAVMDGRQVALLVPTTILAQQHYTTFGQRLAPYPVTVEMLSRFRSRAEQEAIVKRLGEGQVDILIGTHRLLQRDVQFKDLGLLIVDEEQRFGVTHKERLKQMRTEVDVLTLTATPIPRTLYMSLTGVRDISTINTPPEERLPIVTHAGPFTERAVRQAVLRELDRNGQVFYVHNRVQTIGVVRQKLERLVPEARLGVAHGQMEERGLAEIMRRFTAGEIDVLLCTSIIESGLDIPNANTLIVDRADAFGLAQLYQLRGRVGRGAARAYAYFFHERRGRMTPEARQRLETIAEQTELGAGYGIAMRDLEMRGAGDLLGMRQHGHIAAVGFHLYTRLLRKAVQQLKRGESQTANLKLQTPAGQPADAAEQAQPPEGLPQEFGPLNLEVVSVDLPIPTIIPPDYVHDRRLRLQLYRRLAELGSEQAVADMRAELSDRFGPLPEPVENLLFQLEIKILAARAGVESVAGEDGQIVLKGSRWATEEERALLAGRLGPGVRLSRRQLWLARAGDQAGWRGRLVEVLARLAEFTVPETVH